ncbi:MAG: hypothetical protein IT456_13410 [Planctomycetes bacterium]|nr:hypothetical protein [Planctomycetota bacterium]
MNGFDAELLKALAEADSALPPAPGQPFATERLAELAARRVWRTWLLATGLVVLSITIVVLSRTPVGGAGSAPGFVEDLARLRADFALLQAQVAAHVEAVAVQDHAAQTAIERRAERAAWQLDLATARADGALAYQKNPHHPETPR